MRALFHRRLLRIKLSQAEAAGDEAAVRDLREQIEDVEAEIEAVRG